MSLNINQYRKQPKNQASFTYIAMQVESSVNSKYYYLESRIKGFKNHPYIVFLCIKFDLTAHCAVVKAEQTKWVVLSCLDVKYMSGQCILCLE